MASFAFVLAAWLGALLALLSLPALGTMKQTAAGHKEHVLMVDECLDLNGKVGWIGTILQSWLGTFSSPAAIAWDVSLILLVLLALSFSDVELRQRRPKTEYELLQQRRRREMSDEQRLLDGSTEECKYEDHGQTGWKGHREGESEDDDDDDGDNDDNDDDEAAVRELRLIRQGVRELGDKEEGEAIKGEGSTRQAGRAGEDDFAARIADAKTRGDTLAREILWQGRRNIIMTARINWPSAFRLTCALLLGRAAIFFCVALSEWLGRTRGCLPLATIPGASGRSKAAIDVVIGSTALTRSDSTIFPGAVAAAFYGPTILRSVVALKRNPALTASYISWRLLERLAAAPNPAIEAVSRMVRYALGSRRYSRSTMSSTLRARSWLIIFLLILLFVSGTAVGVSLPLLCGWRSPKQVGLGILVGFFFHGIHTSICSAALPFFFLEQLPVLATRKNKRNKLLPAIISCICIYVATLVAANGSIARSELVKLLGGWMRVVADVALFLALVAVVPKHLKTPVAGTFRYDAIVSSREDEDFDAPISVRAMEARAKRVGLGSRF